MAKSQYMIYVTIMILLLVAPISFAEEDDIIWGDRSEIRAFGLYTGDPRCNQREITWVKFDPDTESVSRTDAEKDCYRDEGVDWIGNEKEFCCPPQTECLQFDGEWICDDTHTNITTCSDYSNEDDCESDLSNVGWQSVEEKYDDLKCGTSSEFGKCSHITDCSCVWYENGGEGSCLPSADYGIVYNETKDWILDFPGDDGDEDDIYDDAEDFCLDNGYVDNGDFDIGGCIYDEERTDLCDEMGHILVEWTGVWEGSGEGESCPDGERRVPCIGMTLLKFIGISGLLLGLILLILFYFISGKKIEKLKE